MVYTLFMFRSIQTKIMFFVMLLAVSLLILTGAFLVFNMEIIVKDLEKDGLKNRALLEASLMENARVKGQDPFTREGLKSLLPDGQDADFFLISSSGQWVGESKGKGQYDLKFSQNAKVQRTYKDGAYHVSAIAKISNTESGEQWFLVAEQKESELYAVINHTKTLVIGFIVLALGVLWIVAKRISFAIQRPIKELSETAAEIAEGDISRNIQTKEGGELDDIAQSFNLMLDRLKSTMQQALLKSGEATYMQDIMDYVKQSYDELPGGIISINNIGDITAFNTTAADLTGLSPKDILGINIQNPIPPEIKALIDSLRRCLSSGKLQMKKIIDIRDVSGTRIPVMYSSNIHFGMDNEVIGAICVFKRVEDIERFEESANRIRNLEALGEMATSLAHEIKNPLTSIRGYTQYINRELSCQKLKLNELDIILYETDRLTNMLDNFLKFARPELPTKTKMSIQGILDYVIQLVENDLPENITIDRDYETVPHVMVDSSQIEAVLLNMVLNSMQAMPEGGKIILRTRYDHTRQMVRIDIQDNGKGVPQELSDKIFQPFFTTRDDGTGMGLPICSRIVERHKGILEFESIEGEMTVFSLLFQAAGTIDNRADHG